MYYAVFDIATERWSAPTLIVAGKIEGPRLTINPLTNDLVLVYDSYLAGINKDIFIKVKTSTGWQKEVDLSLGTQEAARPSDRRTALAVRAGNDRTRIQAPHGQLAETNAWVSVDESDGFVYVTWKADKWNEPLAKWELQIVVALLDPSYKMVWFGRVTHDYEGFHVLPTIAAIDGRSMMAFAWQQEGGYYYIDFVKNGNTLAYDPAVLYDHRIAACPIVPHWEFFSYVVAHGDEMMFVYKDPSKQTNLLRFTIDGKREDKLPIDLCNDEPSLWPIDVFSDLEVGLLTVWATPREGNASIHYSIYDYPKTVVKSPLNLRVETRLERSFFRGHYLNSLTWESNPYNTAHNVNVSGYRIYRKPMGGDRSQYVRIGEVSATTLAYGDSEGIGAVNTFDYAVTCFDGQGHESTPL